MTTTQATAPQNPGAAGGLAAPCASARTQKTAPVVTLCRVSDTRTDSGGRHRCCRTVPAGAPRPTPPTTRPELAGTGHEALPLIAEEKTWTRDLFTVLLAEMGVPEPARRGRELVLVHEGAVVQLTAGSHPGAMADARELARRLVAEAVVARDATPPPRRLEA